MPEGAVPDSPVLSALDSCLGAWQQADAWDAFAEALAPVETAAARAGHLALQDVCVILRERLAELAVTTPVPDEEQCAVLATWPSFASAWVQAPGEPHLGELLVDFLRHPMWPRTITDDEAERLRTMLGVESGAHGTASLLEAVIEDINAHPEGDARDDDGLPGYDGLSGYAKIGARVPGGGRFVPAVRARMAAGADDHPVADRRGERDRDEGRKERGEASVPPEPKPGATKAASGEPDAPAPRAPEAPSGDAGIESRVDAFTEAAGDTPQAHDPLLAGIEEAEAAFAEFHDEAEHPEPPCPALGGADTAAAEAPAVESEGGFELPATAHEMLHLLGGEATYITGVLADILPLVTDDDADDTERREALEHFAEQVERLDGAVELLGLEGLHRVQQRFHENVLALAGGGPMSPELAELLVHVCTALPDYLEQPADRSSGEALTSLLGHGAWPRPADAEWTARVNALLAAPVVYIEDDGIEARARRALPQDVSLDLPDDVDTEVLDGLLQDLPGQTAEFARSVEALVSGGTPEDLEVAQRIAHTVKCAAHTVGVAGLANLTHHLEDILLALGRHGVMPGPELGEVLVHASDCLESMGEALLGMSAPPTDALETMQCVLDWANTIDGEGVAADAVTAHSRAEGETDGASQANTSGDPDDGDRAPAPGTGTVSTAAATPMVRVPAPLVDDLLRLVGESIVLTGQIQERLNMTACEAQNMREQYMLVQQLGREMEELIDLRGLSLPQQRVVGSEAFGALEFDQYNELHTCSRRLVEAATDTREVGENLEDHLSALSDMLSDQSRLNRENQEAVLKTRMVEVQSIVPRLQRSVRQASRLAGKNVALHCIGADTMMDNDVLARLLDPLTHVLRNAVDHGIEPEVRRIDADKDRTGHIRLAFQREGNHIVIRCDDDGAGLDIEAIHAAARARDMVGENEQLSAEELAQLVLLPNFTTRAEATQLSGRGIGLDAVNMQVTVLGGSLRLHSEPGEGCRVTMRLPLTPV